MPKTMVPLSFMPLPALILNHEGFVQKINDQAMSSLGLSQKLLLGRHVSTLFTPEKTLHDMVQRTIQDGEATIHYGLEQQGSRQPYVLHSGPFDDGALLLMVPEENRRSMDRYHRKMEMADSASRIALEMAHEIKNPLAALKGAAQWLGGRTRDKEVVDATDMMNEEVDRIRDRIDHFLQLGPRSFNDAQLVNIHSIIDDVCRNGSVILERFYDPSIPEFMGHPGRIRRVVENLWRNSLESGATKVAWHTNMSMTPAPGFRGHHIDASIIDDGCGVSPNVRKNIFQPYVTSKERGSGLGLAISQRIMLDHRGQLLLDEHSEKTVFIMRFPVGRRT